MEDKAITGSRNFRIGAVVVCGALLLVIGFCLGRFSGLRREAVFGRFGGQGMYGMMGGGYRLSRSGWNGYGMMGSRFGGNYAAMGPVLTVSGTSFTVADRASGAQKTVTTDSATQVFISGNQVSAADIKAGDMVLVTGTTAANGGITATQVQIMPWGPGSQLNSTSTPTI